MNILDKIIERKKQEIKDSKSKTSVAQLKDSEFFGRKTFSLKETLKTKSGIIAEFKRKSPSKGIINDKSNPIKRAIPILIKLNIYLAFTIVFLLKGKVII